MSLVGGVAIGNFAKGALFALYAPLVFIYSSPDNPWNDRKWIPKYIQIYAEGLYITRYNWANMSCTIYWAYNYTN